MKEVLTFIVIMIISLGCDVKPKFSNGKFFNDLTAYKKESFMIYENFRKVSLEEYRNDNKDYLEKGFQAFDLVNLINQGEKNQPIILYFNAHGSQNCRNVEEQILNQPEIYKRLNSEFLFIPLTVDDRKFLEEESHIALSEECSNYGSKRILKRISAVNVNLQINICQAGSQPYFYAFNVNSEIDILT